MTNKESYEECVNLHLGAIPKVCEAARLAWGEMNLDWDVLRAHIGLLQVASEPWTEEDLLLIPPEVRDVIFAKLTYGITTIDGYMVSIDNLKSLRVRATVDRYNRGMREAGVLADDLLSVEGGRVCVNLEAIRSELSEEGEAAQVAEGD